MVRLAPGDPFSPQGDKALDPVILQELKTLYKLDQPMLQQFGSYLRALVFEGEFGPSLRNPGRSVGSIIASGLPVSLMIGLGGLITALLLGVPTGIFAALNHRRTEDRITMSLAMTGICLPSFVLGPILALLLGLKLGWFNVAGWFEPRDAVVPSLTLGIVYAAYIARLLRGGILEVWKEDYVMAAKAKGLSPTRVLLRHIMPGAIQPLISFLGPAAAGLISGSFVVENIFQIPGLGQHFVSSAQNRDYWLVCGTVVVYSALIVAFNMLVDILQAWINPRLRGKATGT
jgi:oligopeptide transport system permease protein